MIPFIEDIASQDKPLVAEIRVDLIDEIPRTSEEVIKSGRSILIFIILFSEFKLIEIKCLEDTCLVETAISPQITEQIKQEPADEKKIEQILGKNCVVG